VEVVEEDVVEELELDELTEEVEDDTVLELELLLELEELTVEVVVGVPPPPPPPQPKAKRLMRVIQISPTEKTANLFNFIE
jgi:hypothetical protein